jgi:hypothetical protein
MVTVRSLSVFCALLDYGAVTVDGRQRWGCTAASC